MSNERYELREGLNAMTYEFSSIRPKGKIDKVVIYSEIDDNVYNLGFGDKNIDTGDIDDLVITNNEDSQKVLATVASTVYVFLSKYPEALIIATGSTKARTRLYQMGISKYLDEITADFNVFGEKDGKLHPFEKNIGYDAFLIMRKRK